MDLKTFANRIAKININSILRKIFNDPNIKEFVIERNQEQLWDRGIDAKGQVIKTYNALGGNVYSNFTMIEKAKKGWRTDVVTLKDTGKFYKTFKVGTQPEYAEINANFEVHGESIAQNVDVTNILGLTQENMPLLIQYIKPLFIKEFKATLFKT